MERGETWPYAKLCKVCFRPTALRFAKLKRTIFGMFVTRVLLSICWQVLTVLAGHLIGAKINLGTTEGVLPAAELVLSMFSKCPGLLRCEKEGKREVG